MNKFLQISFSHIIPHSSVNHLSIHKMLAIPFLLSERCCDLEWLFHEKMPIHCAIYYPEYTNMKLKNYTTVQYNNLPHRITKHSILYRTWISTWDLQESLLHLFALDIGVTLEQVKLHAGLICKTKNIYTRICWSFWTAATFFQSRSFTPIKINHFTGGDVSGHFKFM